MGSLLMHYKIKIVAWLFLALFLVSCLGLLLPYRSSTGYSSQIPDNSQSLGQLLPLILADSSTTPTTVLGKSEFRVVIPSIGLDQSVIEEVDPADEKIYAPVLLQNIAHGKYTRLPDEAVVDGNIYLFAHRRGFFQGKDIGFFARLGELKSGSMVTILYAGNKYTYIFNRSFVIKPTDTWVYTDEAAEPTLTLQTCENGESQRLIVQFTLTSVTKA